MKKFAQRTIKSEDVEICGTYSIGTGSSPERAPGKNGAAGIAPQANVVERHPAYAVVEIICSCGSKMYLRCDYAAASENQEIETAAPAAS